MNYLLHLLVLLEIYGLLAISANQMIGYSGLLSLGQAIFYGLGAYSTAILMTKYSFNYWETLPVVAAVNCLAALLTGFIANRVRDLYFSLAMLALQVVFFSFTNNSTAVTNGSFGISAIDSPHLFGTTITGPAGFAILGGLFLGLVLLLYRWFISSPVHLLIQATRDDQLAVLNFAKNPNYYKRISIIFSAVVAGIAGSLYATYFSYIDPGAFNLDTSILLFSIVLIGGLGSLRGALAGAAIYILLPEALRLANLPDSIAANLRMVLFGLLIIVIVLFKPKGIFGKLSI